MICGEDIKSGIAEVHDVFSQLKKVGRIRR